MADTQPTMEDVAPAPADGIDRTDLQRALDTLTRKQPRVRALLDYYEGDQPLKFSTKRLREVFNAFDVDFAENWCAVVIDSCADRINLLKLSIASDDAAQTLLDAIWKVANGAIAADDVQETALICGESFLICWPDPATLQPQVFHNSPECVHLFTDPENPARKVYAAKWWIEADGSRRVTLWYPDRIEYWTGKQKPGAAPNAKAFKLAPVREGLTNPAANPFGIVPVFRFQNKRCMSDLGSITPMQDAVNKMVADMLVTSEFGVFPQRYVIGQIESLGKLKNSPNEIWQLPSGDGVGQPTTAGQFDPAKLEPFLAGIAGLVSAIAAISRTPKHYFELSGNVPSGEALVAMEAPLVRKAQDRILRFEPTWREVGAALLLMAEHPVQVEAVTPVFAPPNTVQPFTEAQIQALDVQAGIPLRTVLRRAGWTDAELEQMEQDRLAEQQLTATTLTAAVSAAQSRFDTMPTDGQNPAILANAGSAGGGQ